MQRSPKDRVFAPRMAHTHHMIHIREREPQKLVGQNAADIRKAKERMIRKDGFESQTLGMKESFMRHAGERLVCVYDLDALTNQNASQHRHQSEKIGQRILSHQHAVRDVIHLDPSRQIPDAHAIRRIGMRNHNDLRQCRRAHLVTTPNQVLADHVHMPLDAAHIREEKVGQESIVNAR